jgi:hypothetical protein
VGVFIFSKTLFHPIDFNPQCTNNTTILFVGHWILNVFPQCKGDLKTMRDASFPLFDPSTADSTVSSDSFFGCNAFSAGD